MQLTLLIFMTLLACFTMASETGVRQATAQAATGLPHRITVDDPRVNDGWRLVLTNADLAGPPPNGTARAENARPTSCADVPIESGIAEVVPDLSNPDCPPGARLLVTVLTGPNVGFVATASPEIEWREARPGETVREVTVRMVPPSTGDTDAGPISPPDTGNAGLKE